MPRDVHPFETWSGEHFLAARAGEIDYPDALYFERKPPAGFDEVKQYVGYRDFHAVYHERTRRYYTQPEPYVRLYHTLVIHFVGEENPEFRQKAYDDLRYQPYNHSHWNDRAPTWKYWLRTDALLPYADTATQEYRIKGIGPKGREIMWAVLRDAIDFT
jgi:hypothetical protein